MVAIAAPSFSTSGYVVLERTTYRSNPFLLQRRVQRTGTLDGGAVLSDLGFSHGDRTLVITQSRPTKTQYDTAAILIQNYQTQVVSTGEGCFLGAMSEVSMSQGDLIITFFVTEKLSA